MNVIARWTPLDLYTEELAIKSRIRTKIFFKETWDGMPINGQTPRGHRRIWDDKTKGMGITDSAPKQEHSWVEWDNPKNDETKLWVYTDGASNDHGAGYSWVAFEKGV